MSLIEHTVEDDATFFSVEVTYEYLELAEVDFNAEEDEPLRVVFGIERLKKGWQETLFVEVERDQDWLTCSAKFRGAEVVEILQELEDANEEYEGLMMALEEMQETLEDSDDY